MSTTLDLLQDMRDPIRKMPFSIVLAENDHAGHKRRKSTSSQTINFTTLCGQSVSANNKARATGHTDDGGNVEEAPATRETDDGGNVEDQQSDQRSSLLKIT